MKHLTHLLFCGAILSITTFGKMAPPFEGELLLGGKTNLKGELQNGKGILLSFWATWCTPCLDELKTLQEKLNRESDKPFSLVTVNVDKSDSSSDVKPTMNLYGFSFKVILDPTHKIYSKYLTVENLPFNVLIDSNGEILIALTGYQDDLFEKAKQMLNPQPNGAITKK